MITGPVSTLSRWLWNRTASYTPAFAFLVCSAALFVSTMDTRSYDPLNVVWDTQWLNALAIGFCMLAVLIWRGPIDEHRRRLLTLGCFSLFGLVAVSLVFNGTPYGYNSYWGDQKFRQAMILKFSTFWRPQDFYYHDRPPFYPPLYFWLLSLWGRIFSVEYFKLLKVGLQLIFLFGPLTVYWFWARVVSKHQAFWIALAVFSLSGLYYHSPLSIPHEFIAASIFIPWWLYYVERVRRVKTNWRFYLVGGLFGAAVLMTYYYAFLVGGLWLLVRHARVIAARLRNRPYDGKPVIAWKVLALTALFSAPYWLPLAISMAAFGNHASQREWFHVDYAGLHFLFLKFSFPGVLFFLGLIYVFRRRVAAANRSVLALVWSSAGIYVIGYVLGNMGQPILYIKANEFLSMMIGVTTGLMLAGLIRWDRRTRRARGAFGLIALILFLICCHDFSGVIRTKEVETARKSSQMDWGTDAEEMAARSGSVFLTANELLPSFFPVFVFNAINQHYSHNASQYLARHQMLLLLEKVQDPVIFHTVLRHNVYDRVDYFMPRAADNQFELWSNLSRYPDRFVARNIRFPMSTVADTAMFIPMKGEYLYQLADRDDLVTERTWHKAFSSRTDSLVFLYYVHLLKSHLNPTGARLLDSYLPIDTTGWVRLDIDASSMISGPEFKLVPDPYLVTMKDSRALLLAVEAQDQISADYRVFLHLYPSESGRLFDNFDFTTQSPSSRWQIRDREVCCRLLPINSKYERLHVGLFNDNGRSGPGWTLKIPPVVR